MLWCELVGRCYSAAKAAGGEVIATAAKQSSSYSINLGLGFSSCKVEKAGELKAAIDGAMRAVNDGKTTILSLVLKD